MIPDKNLTHVAFHVARERYEADEDKFGPPANTDIARLESLPPFQVASELGFTPDRLQTPDGRELEPWVKCVVRPLVDTPLRTASLCRLPDGRMILAGSDGRLKVRLWQSRDGVQWGDLATAIDFGDPATGRYPDRQVNYWTRFAGADGVQQPRRGIDSVSIHALRGTCWLVVALNGVGTGLWKSVSGNPAGPYESMPVVLGQGAPQRLLTRAASASLFEDPDGSVHVVWDEGWIARLRDDLGGLAETPLLLTVATESRFNDFPLFCGRRGARIVRTEGRYALIASEVNPRLGGNPCHDTFVAMADSLHGPYGRRKLLVPHGGAADVFQDASGRWNALCVAHVEDHFARCRERATIVPLVFDRGMQRPCRRLWTVTEDGPVSLLKPGLESTTGRPVEIRDPQALVDADGWIYVAGTHRKTAGGVAGIRLWRSRDFTSWEPVRGAGDRGDFVWLASESTWATQTAMHDDVNAPECRQWGAQLFAHNGTYYIPFFIWPFHQTGILKSVSGRPEGPYVETGFLRRDGSPHLFRDDDGQVWIYFCFGPTRVAPLNADLSDLAGPLTDVTYQDDRQQGFEGSWILKTGGKYVLFQTDWWGENQSQRNSDKGECWYGYPRYGTYDWMYCVADHIRGPYGPPRLAVPHGGTCSVVRAPDGRWLASVFGSDSTAPFVCSLGFIELDIRAQGGDVLVKVKS